ncbi:MAG: hypothetical protein EPN93_18055 [Spirochaetes bacterium]|nr:MAG: hypothetical protein EPN93_18055 [Spirochaetota bacterium]
METQSDPCEKEMETEKKSEILGKVAAFDKAFRAFNSRKVESLYAAIGDQKIIDLFDSIPFLLSVNQPSLPGFVEYPEMPQGIYRYEAKPRVPAFVRGLFPAANISTGQGIQPFIQMFALMGSGGTIAFSKHSDFDFWVCADESQASPEALRIFKSKFRLIEEWIAEHFNVEVHFFLNDISKVRRNIFDDNSEDNFSGTSLGVLLKEEFFRSSIIIAGKTPFWWVVPAGCSDSEYGEWLLAADGAALVNEYIDLGNLSMIGRDDFLVAALFQLLKSLGSPFKSILKLGLLERYIHSTGTNPFISTIIKKNVHEGKLYTQAVDSYVIMFNQVYNYYAAMIKDSLATELLTICFYLKVDPRLSYTPRNHPEAAQSEKVRNMAAYIAKWEWADSLLAKLDNFENLDIDSVTKLMNDTKKFMLRGYKDILGAIESKKAAHLLSDSELQGISRKIYSHFAIADNKIDNTLSFKNYPPEKLLTIEFVRDKEGREFWLLSKRVIISNSPAKVILYKDNRFVGIIVWLGLNRLFQKDYTRLEMDPGILPADPNYIRELIAQLTTHFTYKRIELHNAYFLKEAFPVVSYIIINPYSKYSKKIDDIIFLYHTSWGETKFDSFKNEIDLAKVFGRILQGALLTRKDYTAAVHLSSSLPYGSTREFDRLTAIIRDMYRFFIDTSDNVRRRYISVIGNKFFLYSNKRVGQEESISATMCESEAQLLYILSNNNGALTSLRIDPGLSELNYLRKILENHKENCIQIYFQQENKYCYFFIMDERGSLFFVRKPAEAFIEYLSRLYVFTLNIVEKVVKNNPRSSLAGQLKQVEIYKLERDLRNSCTISEINPELSKNIVEARKGIVPLTLAVHPLETGEPGYGFTHPDGSFTNPFSRASIRQVIGELRVFMQTNRGYLYYPTDTDLTLIPNKAYKLFTSISFTHKGLFEMLIESGMK